jgi:hypothetical protein
VPRTAWPSVPVALHLAPSPAHRVLADRAAEQGGKRTAHTTRIGAGEVGLGEVLASSLEGLFADHGAPVAFHRWLAFGSVPTRYVRLQCRTPLRVSFVGGGT